MNEYQQRRLLHGFQRVDELLSEAERIMASVDASAFRRYAVDTTPLQRKVTHDYAVRVREGMCRILDELQISLPPPNSGALWAARGHISFALVAVAEMTPERLRHSGELADEDSRRINQIVAELNGGLKKLEDFLAQGAAGDLQARLQRLERTRDEVRLLGELDRIVTSHGLVEFRDPLEDVLERLEQPIFRIGVFGRVSSGKSSLLNYLFGEAYLPIGVTPVTAVPLRIKAGSHARASVEFVERQPIVIGLERLSEFSTEQQNPGNGKHVARIDIEIPARRLCQGVMFVDTPGLGSLATVGAEETLAYLPKCDLGIVLVDASSALSHEDLFVVQSLLQAGAGAMVLVSKADVLQPLDRVQMADYVRQQLALQADLEVPVHLVSVVGTEAELCDAWVENALRPYLISEGNAASAALKRKAGLLRMGVMQALAVRLERSENSGSWERADTLLDAAAALRCSHTVIEVASKHGRILRERFDRLGPAALRAAAVDIAGEWRGGNADTIGTLIQSLNRFLSEQSAAFVRSVEEVRRDLARVLKKASVAFGSSGEAPEELPEPSGLPMVDLAQLTERVQLRKPLLPGKFALRRFAESRLLTQLGAEMSELMRTTGSRLEDWHRQAVEDLRKAFDRFAARDRAKIAQAETVELESGNVPKIEADLAILERWEVELSG
jgi:GTP-binding protein EngB required for normal cell division